LSSKRASNQSAQFTIKIPPDKLDLLVGMRLEDRYYVMSLLGKGGMSLVYKAKDLKTGEVVAVKCLRTQVLGDEMVVKRFQREAEVLNRLNHPRIVQFFGYGTNRRGQPYFVMDYLIGTSLGEILRKQGRLDLGRFQDIFVQVAAAIGHAHKHDAVHRDIKPGNIMLVEKGTTSDYVKIVDFGIAKVTEGQQKLTRLGEVWGSPIYMSPEQCTGSVIDARTDIYSLGIVMYEALTGEVPFLGRNYADTMMKQMTEEPPTFKQVNPKVDIPPVLEQIVFRAIKKKPDERYQSMNDLKHDLERALNQSLGQTPKQQSALLTMSGRQKTTEQDQPQTSDPRKATSEQQKPKVERQTIDIQQKVTAEDIPRFAPSDKLSKTDLSKAPTPPPAPPQMPQPRAQNIQLQPSNLQPELPRLLPPQPTPPPPPQPQPAPMEVGENFDFEPPEDRLKFELTGPQIISASTESNTRRKPTGMEVRPDGENQAEFGSRSPRPDNPDNPNASDKRSIRSTSDNPRVSGNRSPRSSGNSPRISRQKVAQSQSVDDASGSAGRRRGRTSRNRLPASTLRDTGTTRGGKQKSGGNMKQVVITILSIAAAFAIGYLNRNYIETLFKDFFYFPAEERTTVRDEESKTRDSGQSKEDSRSQTEDSGSDNGSTFDL
jgi:serine/threonine-protein kinase